MKEKEQKRLEKVLDAAQQAVPEEVSALIGATLKISNSSYQLKNKEDAFDSLASKQILSKMDVRGDIEGEGCLLVSVKAAIRLGGTLIMLPVSELDEVVAAETYTEETEDSYGEIANIIAGAYSKTFEDLYPKKCRLIRKEQSIISPTKIDIKSDEPVTDQMYYVITQDMSLDDKEMGELNLLLPATTFDLIEEGAADDAVVEEAAGEMTESETSQENQTEHSEQATSEVGETNNPVEEENASVVAYNPKNLPKIDTILEASQVMLCEEVSGLIGAELKITETALAFQTKEEIFDNLNSKQIAAKMDVRGDIEGDGALFVSLKGAIRLGGTLIMLPQTELEESIGREEYNEETEDSFGEIANIIAGSYSKVLEDMYPKNCRLIRKEQSLITPVKVDLSSDEPISEQVYYVVKSICELDGINCGEMVMALPAITFGILESNVAETAEGTKAGITPKAEGDESVSVGEQAQEAPKPIAPKFDSDKQKERVDKLLETCKEKIKEEVGAMLGVDVSLESIENKLTTKEDFFFDEASGKQVMALCDVVGDEEDKTFFFVGLKDAVRIGGILIMLPPSELEIAVSEEEYTEDTQDAYGEIANIISGVYTAVFEENYSKKLRFIRKELETVVPMKVEIESDEPFPDQLYYLHALNLTIGDKDLGKMQMLFPATLLQLERLGEVEELIEESKPEPSVEGSIASTQESSAGSTATTLDSDQGEIERYDVIVIGNDEHEKTKLQTVIEGKGMRVRNLTFKENIYNYVNQDVKAVFLVMQEVNELAFGVAIKISTACSCPLVAAGSAWTRTTVIKAVKYGVTDILLTPASNVDIEEKIESNHIKMAA